MLRDEYPRYNLIRPSWQSLNGTWQCEVADFDPKSAVYYLSNDLPNSISVPFSAGCQSSGFACYKPIRSIWYRRTFVVPKKHLSGAILLHFGAVDNRAEVYINGTLALVHKGGYTPFSADISALCHEGNNFIVVNALDSDSDSTMPSGYQFKQNAKECHPQIVGIWQSVWLEFATKSYFYDMRPTALCEKKAILLEGNITNPTENGTIIVKITQDNVEVAAYQFKQQAHYILTCPINIPLKFWNILDSHLYNIEATMYAPDGSVQDKIYTYTAFRSIQFDRDKFMLNGKHTIIKGVKACAFYKSSYYTAHSAGTLKQGLINAVSLGYNTIVISEKVPEPLFLHFCDKLGIMVIPTYPTANLDYDAIGTKKALHSEWLEVLSRDYGHPCIVCWNPITSGKFDGDLNYNLMIETKTRDRSRPYIDNSSGLQFNTEMYAKALNITDRDKFLAHLYTPYNGVFLDDKAEAKLYAKHPKLLKRSALKQLPMLISSFGRGIVKPIMTEEDEKEFLDHYEFMVSSMIIAKSCGFVFDMLYDTGNMQWGIYNSDMNCKFSKEGRDELQRINSLYFNKK
ncbi:MAG: hypothetical protein R3Y23_02880 [Bacillota bacterium]